MAKTRYVRADADGAGNGTTSVVGGANGAWTWAQFLGNLPRHGDHYHIKGPFTYTVTTDLDFFSGMGDEPIIMEGWNTVPGDNPTGTNRPLIACGPWDFHLGGYTFFKNFRTTHTNWRGCLIDPPASVVINCASRNTGPLGETPHAYSGWGGVWIDCDAQSTWGGWFGQGNIIGCCAHDCVYGIITWQSLHVRGNIIKDCTYGLWLGYGVGGLHTFVRDNIFYNCTQIGIKGELECFGPILNNIFDSGGDGINFDTPAGRVVWLDFNNFDNLSGSRAVNVDRGRDTSSDDPAFFNALVDDFRIGPDIKGLGFPKFEWYFMHLFPDDADSWADQGALQRWEIIGETAAVQETGANAQSAGSCVKLSPSTTDRPLAWVFLVPCENAVPFTVLLWHKVTSGFNGSLDFSAFGSGVTPIEHANIPLTDDGVYHQYLSGVLTPTSDGYVTVMLQAYDGAVSGDIFIDDITTSDSGT